LSDELDKLIDEALLEEESKEEIKEEKETIETKTAGAKQMELSLEEEPEVKPETKTEPETKVEVEPKEEPKEEKKEEIKVELDLTETKKEETKPKVTVPAKVTTKPEETKPSSELEDLLTEKKEVLADTFVSEIEKDSILFGADKSDGKSTAALSFPGRIFVFAYDNQALTAARNLKNFPKDSPLSKKAVKMKQVVEGDYVYYIFYDVNGKVSIEVHLLNQLFRPRDTSDEEIGRAATAVINKTFEVLTELEERVKRDPSARPDWIVVDNFELFVRWAEWHGRYDRKIPIFQKGALPGQDFWGVFDERLALIRVFWSRVMALAKRGVIYTTYVKEVEDTFTGAKRKIPKWVEAVKYETMHHILIWKEFMPDGKPRYCAKILGSKDISKYPDGVELDITNKGFYQALQDYLSSRKQEERSELFS
jgi:hypothetical protein